MPDGQCQRSKRQCRLFAGAGEVREIMAGIHREIARVGKDLVGLRAANEHLKGSEELDDEALRKIYAAVLLTGRDEPGAREAPLKEVFDFYCVKGFSAQEVSVKLGCSKATVMNRLATLRKIAGVPASELRTYKPFFEQTEKVLQEPRARRVRPEDAVYGDESLG
jgi:DNA-directed RNA polymerase specialized sigma24 family protein